MPHLNKIQKKYGKKGLVVIGATQEQEGAVQRLRQRVNMDFKIFAGYSGGGYPVRQLGIPATFIVGADGKVFWQGKPSGVSDSLIQKALRKRRSYLAKNFRGAPKSAINAMVRGQWGKAYKTASKAAQKETKEEKKEAAQKLAKFLKSKLSEELATANLLFQRKEYSLAYKTYKKMSKGCKGTDLGDQASESLKAYKDKGLKKQHKMLVYLEKQIQKFRRQKGKKGRIAGAKFLQSFARKYSGTAAGDKAARLIQALTGQ